MQSNYKQINLIKFKYLATSSCKRCAHTLLMLITFDYIGIVHSRGVNYFMGMIWWHSCVSCSDIMHSFQKLVSDLVIFCTYYVHYKTLIGFALSVSGQSLYIPYLGHLLWILQSMKGINI